VSEHIEILLMLSQTYGRLGDEAEAERSASECVETAKEHGDLMLLAQAVNRLAATQLQNAPARAEDNYHQALSIAEQIGDARTQARCHINLAGIAARRNDWETARHSYGRGIALARGAGMPDLWGTSALNLGVGCYRTGDYDRARELLGEALALVAAVKNSEIQLYALYNMANVEWEHGGWESGAELYEATASLAQRIGADDVEIGALAALGLCSIEGGKIGNAREAYAEIEERVHRRPDWFQGREFFEALRVALLVADGRPDEALERYETAMVFAESSDLYTAAWLTANCGRRLVPLAPDRMRQWIDRYRSPIEQFGYTGIAKRFKELGAG
jgi:tetratricopeptide (TPR) repeat protein